VISRAVVLGLGAAALGGCDLSMTEQARHETAASDTLWEGGPRDLPPPAGAVAQSAPEAARISAAPPPMSLALMRRGQEQYGVYCTPCHGANGSGDGPVVRRGFPRPRDLAAPDQRALTAQALFQVVGQGSGFMYGEGDRIAPQDRWAIAAYVRALQLARATGRLGPSAPVASPPIPRGAETIGAGGRPT
jgi:mono/diheme cytochrome c family protein